MISKIQRRNKIKTRIRGKVSGTAARPRMTVFRSNKQIYVQLVDDLEGKTLVAASSKGLEGGTKTEIAAKVGKAAAEKALAAGIDVYKRQPLACVLVWTAGISAPFSLATPSWNIMTPESSRR